MKIMRRAARLYIPWIVSIAVLAGLITLALPASQPADGQAHDSWPGDTLTVITTRSYHTYFDGKKDRPDGLAFQLVRQFARQHGLKLDIIIAPHVDDIYPALDKGIADIGLVGRPLSLSRQNSYPQSQSYMNVTSQLVYRHGTGTPATFEELAGKTVLVPDNEQYREKYAFIQSHYPDVSWQFARQGSEQLMAMVDNGDIDYTLVDSHEFIKLRARYTRTRVAFDIYYPEPVSLALSSQAEQLLGEQLHDYFDHIKADGSLAQLTERYYGHASDSNPRGSMTFFQRVETRLPHYQDLIEEIASEHNMDWRLLAAIAYQESHWNPHARSHTGVRGMMMLTLPTARETGIRNRLDARQSLQGGARYLQSILTRLPDSIKQPDRTWFALAAYNVGLGHLLDARDITEFHGGNPDQWASVKNYLPLLEKEEWYRYTRHGQARGSEPVRYVQNIRHFNDLLEWRFPASNLTPEPGARLAVKPLEKALREAQQRQTDPSHGPVRLAALITE